MPANIMETQDNISSSSSYESQYALHMQSIMHGFVLFGGVCAATSKF